MEYVFIEEQSFLDFYVSDMKGASVLAIDTEFMRKEKYYPEVCLIQICYLQDRESTTKIFKVA